MTAPIVAAIPRVASSSIVVHSEAAPQFIDITEEIVGLVRASEVGQGLAVVASQHTTASILINEHEPELLKDLQRLLHDVAPRERHYHHNLAPCLPGELPNGHSHCQALLLNSSATLPIVNGSPVLGAWQRIFLVELDHARRRQVTVTVVGT